MGVKSDLLDHTVRLNAAAFYYNFHNLQVQQQIVGGSGQTNAGAAEYKGIDLDVTVAPTHNLTLYGSVELLDAKYTTFAGALFNEPCTSPTVNASCATSVGGGGAYTVFKSAVGYQIPFADPFTANLNANYRIPTDFGDFSLVGSLAFHDGFYFDVQNSLKQPAYYLVDASIMWTAPSGQYDLKLWTKNLTDLKYYGQIQENANVTDYSAASPRTIGITAGYHWN
jgi:iron complex outermembrane receptor protein